MLNDGNIHVIFSVRQTEIASYTVVHTNKQEHVVNKSVPSFELEVHYQQVSDFLKAISLFLSWNGLFRSFQ